MARMARLKPHFRLTKVMFGKNSVILTEILINPAIAIDRIESQDWSEAEENTNFDENKVEELVQWNQIRKQ